MGQTWTENCYDASHIVNTDMSNIEINFATLKSAFSGIAAPAAIVAGQIYFNTSKNLHHFLNAAESDLLGLLPGDLSTKIWQYRNDATPGWVIDASVTDKVIALKGGSDAYNVNGGTTAGGWTQPNHTHTVGVHTHGLSSHTHSIPALTLNTGTSFQNIIEATSYKSYMSSTVTNTTGGSSPNNTESGGIANSGGGATPVTYRPAAAVGTLQYPNVTQT